MMPSQYAAPLPNCTAGGKGGEALWRDWTKRAPPTQVQSSTTDHPNRSDGRHRAPDRNTDAARFELFGQLQCSPEFSKNPDLRGRATVNRKRTDVAPHSDGSPLAMSNAAIEAGPGRSRLALDNPVVRAGRRKNDITSMDHASPRGPGLILEQVPPQNVGGHGCRRATNTHLPARLLLLVPHLPRPPRALLLALEVFGTPGS